MEILNKILCSTFDKKLTYLEKSSKLHYEQIIKGKDNCAFGIKQCEFYMTKIEEKQKSKMTPRPSIGGGVSMIYSAGTQTGVDKSFLSTTTSKSFLTNKNSIATRNKTPFREKNKLGQSFLKTEMDIETTPQPKRMPTTPTNFKKNYKIKKGLSLVGMRSKTQINQNRSKTPTNDTGRLLNLTSSKSTKQIKSQIFKKRNTKTEKELLDDIDFNVSRIIQIDQNAQDDILTNIPIV